jgi:hypothetical protein
MQKRGGRRGNGENRRRWKETRERTIRRMKGTSKNTTSVLFTCPPPHFSSPENRHSLRVSEKDNDEQNLQHVTQSGKRNPRKRWSIRFLNNLCWRQEGLHPDVQWVCSTPCNFLLCSPAQPTEVSYAGLLSSASYGNTALSRYILCINRLRASC